jgi:hypothetical protein
MLEQGPALPRGALDDPAAPSGRNVVQGASAAATPTAINPAMVIATLAPLYPSARGSWGPHPNGLIGASAASTSLLSSGRFSHFSRVSSSEFPSSISKTSSICFAKRSL